MARPVSYIQVGGQRIEANSAQLPATGRVFRDAWEVNGDVIEVNMAKAREMRVEQLLREATGAADAAEKAQRMKAALGVSAQEIAAEAAKVARFRGIPSQAAAKVIADATTPDELAAVTLDQFMP